MKARLDPDSGAKTNRRNGRSGARLPAEKAAEAHRAEPPTNPATPHPLGFFPMKRFLRNQDLLSRILSLQYGKLTPDQLLKLRERLEATHDAHPMGLTVGTGCSGSEVIMLVLSKLADVWRSTFGISITFRHLFSIESVHWKRQ